MEISSVGSLTTALSQPQNAEAAGLLVLKKAIDIQAQNALQLLQALPPVTSNPTNLGNSVDVRA